MEKTAGAKAILVGQSKALAGSLPHSEVTQNNFR